MEPRGTAALARQGVSQWSAAAQVGACARHARFQWATACAFWQTVSQLAPWAVG
jgi:hypothetical protein